MQPKFTRSFFSLALKLMARNIKNAAYRRVLPVFLAGTFFHVVYAGGGGGGCSGTVITSNARVSQWYFANLAGISFSSGSPVAVSGGLIVSPAMEGCAVMSDTSGSLLFYTNGNTVWDRTHTVMPNGTGLYGSSSTTQSSVIVPRPGYPYRYYIFTADGLTSGQPYGGVFAYSEADMQLNGGMGEVIAATKNTVLYSITSEKMAAVQHTNGCDVWVLSHMQSTNEFYTYRVSSAGVTGPVISAVGSVYADGGQMKVSPNGTKVAAVTGFPAQLVEIYDFNRSTGVVSNPVSITGINNPYGVEFSPDASRLYVNKRFTDAVYQYNLLAANIASSQTAVGTPSNTPYAMQLGPDGKIYMIINNAGSLAVICSPNTLGSGCNYTDAGFSLGGPVARIGLPNFISTYLTDPTNNCSVLPVGWLDFSVKNIGGVNRLKWQTGHERNNNYFIIERGTDADGKGLQWFEAGHVAGSGNSSSLLTYLFDDRDFTAESASCYYRLKQVDYVGTVTYSNIIHASPSVRGPARVLCAAISEGQFVYHVQIEEAAEVEAVLYNMLGQSSGIMTAGLHTPGIHRITAGIPFTGHGTYLAVIRIGDTSHAMRFAY